MKKKDDIGNLHALDHYIITKDVTKFVFLYFKEEIDSGSIFDDEEFIIALFDRT